MKPGRRLKDLGEDAVVAALTRGLPVSSEVRVGAGDDCAVLGKPRARWWDLLKADVVVEGVHFLPDADPARVGWKALCRAISDIAAMGGQPANAVVTIALSPETSIAWLQGLYRGLNRAARRHGVSIVGGETAKSPGPAFINIALTGRVQRRHCRLRSGGNPGDLLYVTGRLGGSITGKHLDFSPRLAEGAWLAASGSVTAMMDLTDGLAADLPRLARASHCGYTLDDAAIPRTRGCTLAQALGDGEDFELLCAITPAKAAKLEHAWKARFPRLELTRIGVLTPRNRAQMKVHGYDHFA